MISLHLVALALCLSLPPASAAHLRTTARDMVEQQVPGVYTNLPLTLDANACPRQLRISQAEPMGDARRQMFAIPHAAISVPDYPSGTLACATSAVPAGSVTRVSATVLRRSGDLDLDRTDPVVDAFATAGEQFFLGFEVGPRVCNGWTLPAATVSMWMAPRGGSTVRARTETNIVSFRGGFKYVYYWSSPPCLYQGSAGEVGTLRKVPSPSPSPSRTPRPSNAVVLPGTNIGVSTVGDGGAGGDGRGSGSDGGVIARPTALPGARLPAGGLTTASVNETRSQRAVCFPSSARVLSMRGGRPQRVPISSVRAGDSLHDGWTSDGTATFSAVVGLSHADARARARFVRLRAGNHTLSLTGSHFLFVGDRLLPARAVRRGDVVFVAPGGRTAAVERVAHKEMQGLFAPVTRSGALVVDGVRASAYTEAIGPPGAHAAMAPVRALGACAARGVEVVASGGRRAMEGMGW